MTPARQQRLIFIVGLITGASIAICFALFALKQNINLFFTPSQVSAGQAPRQHIFRLGGIVEKNSVHYAPNTSQVEFMLADNNHQIKVIYNGILPTLFREGQGIVAEGRLANNGDFIATQVLAKHDENYMPPEVQSALK